ncbi:putative bifunctional diguanylate cyclase/phosphodiesterase [Dendronalium sp. ChiSLP03b]|uniref:putative bifunctional diguanylate cyclase/phosphodiesterase n=1 Tax=Dendronalium sp. ChiSLP03b TaxID=3075381 RepID=UPI002AD33086|nr:EAL domain-containing protein [Dendronalium sp. ChiSLP03b]MDZ8203233.1 EAL domain-containing protein [Dendronalium sp. ChiSLP03b]
MRTSKKIEAEIREKFGFFPPFFKLAEHNTQVLENLWQQTLSAYINNPISALFKEKLFAYLSRYCSVPYCLICHSCALRTLGLKTQEVLELLESPPPTEKEIAAHLYTLVRSDSEQIILSDLNPAIEKSLFYCSIFIFLEREQSEYCRTELRRLLGPMNYQHLVTFLAYIKTCHVWMEAHPEINYEPDNRVVEQLSSLLEETPKLADFFCNYIEKVRREQQIWAEQAIQLAQRQRHQQAIRKACDDLERQVEEATAKLSVSSMLLKQEIGDRLQAEAQLLHITDRDALTGLPNRTLFMKRLGQTIERTKKSKDLFAVLFLDLDRFKVVNDSLGHTSGDRLLIAFAQRLKSCLQSGDTLARLGGDEFAILLEEIQEINDAIQIAEQLQQELTIPFYLNRHEVFTTVSIGIALSTTGYDQPENLLRDADIAMYRAKALGKARYKIFDTVMYSETTKLLQLEIDLRRAVERQEFLIHYQPIVSLKTDKIIGFEALVRWQHPEQGLVFPTEFIPVAEETGLIVPIGYWVLREACRQLHEWQQQFLENKLIISVNLSSKHLLQSHLSEQIRQILRENSLEPHNLKLEITESVLMENTQSVRTKLLQLRELGIELYLDDFGTGYSSLSYLHCFPINVLKIDRSFVNRMDINGESAEIVRTIIALAHNLGIDVTAEGIETVEQLKQLRILQCKHGQGNFFSKPVPASAARALIAKQLDLYQFVIHN